MNRREQEALVAPCGMNCALCWAYQAQAYDLKKQGFNRKYCPGCNPRGKHCLHMSKICETVGKGRVRFCYECADFPCERLKRLDLRYRTKYHLSMIDNLRFIRDQGMEAFLRNQENRWTCEKCGEHMVCCHNGLCLYCDLEYLKKNRKFRWGEDGAES